MRSTAERQNIPVACDWNLQLETQTMISGDLGYVEKEKLQELRGKIGDSESMLKALIKKLESKHLNPGTLSPNQLGEEPNLLTQAGS